MFCMSRICAAMRLHQLKFSCGDARRRCAEFGSRFRLQVTDQGNDCDFLAMRGQVVFSFTQVDGVARDTLSEVVFHVQDLKSVVSRAEINGANIITPNDKSRMTVGCPVGNLQLTFCQCVDCQCLKSQVADVFSHVDHITLAVEPGSSSRMLEWFEKCFNFLRFPMNPQEMDEGLSIYSTDTGLRLLALQYWHCSEVGLRTPSTSKDKCDVKFVIAEPLVGNGPNQVAAFLEEHGGPGVQHVGLCTSNIVEAMDQLREAGVEFIQPPAEYYEQGGRRRAIESVGESIEALQTRGILLDTEADAKTERSARSRYLMQSFTKPLFEQDTFFLEVIQRCGATGFGAGNIKALWEALAVHLQRKTSTS